MKRSTLIIYKVLIVLLPLIWQTPATAQPTAAKKTKVVQKTSQNSRTKLTYKVIDALNETYSYDIYSNGKLLIHQDSKPGLPGKEGFKTKVAARAHGL